MTPLGSPWPATAARPRRGDRDRRRRRRGARRRFGTPLYVYDAATLRERARGLRRGAAGHPDAHFSFACKACCTVGVLRAARRMRAGRRRRQRGRARRRAARRIDRRGSSCTATARPTRHRGRDRRGLLAVVLDGPDEGAASRPRRAHGRRQPVAVRVTPGSSPAGTQDRDGPRRLEVRPRARRRRARLPSSRSPIPISTGAGCTSTSARRSTTRACSRAWSLVPRVLRRACARAAPDRRRRRPQHPVRARVAHPTPGRSPPPSRLRRCSSSPRAAADRARALGRRPGRRDALPRAHAQDGRRRHALGGARRRDGRQRAPGDVRRGYTVAAAGRLTRPPASASRSPGATASRGRARARRRPPAARAPATSSRSPRRARTASRWRRPTTRCRARRRAGGGRRGAPAHPPRDDRTSLAFRRNVTSFCGRGQPITTIATLRGPWAPVTRIFSMSEVALAPVTSVIARGTSPARPSRSPRPGWRACGRRASTAMCCQGAAPWRASGPRRRSAPYRPGNTADRARDAENALAGAVTAERGRVERHHDRVAAPEAERRWRPSSRPCASARP